MAFVKNHCDYKNTMDHIPFFLKVLKIGNSSGGQNAQRLTACHGIYYGPKLNTQPD
jgi:hypothetical protein